ncbi:ParB/Srx family N-terminal domain-containing protein [Orrella sp. JC864]|uniref:ParB/Srx family N-terminal domain-containing protein n=1 Tax=Orrella sp. JC864 TaxID=3120298 RepID=UPI003009F173
MSLFSLLFPLAVRRALAALTLPLALAACSSSDDDPPEPPPAADEAEPPLAEPPAEPPVEPAPLPHVDAQPGDLLEVPIGSLRPTQAAIGYDQVYYKLGRWQPDMARPTWAADPASHLNYLNRTLGKKFDDFCEDTGQGERAQPFQTLDEALAARLDVPGSFACRDAPGTDADALKTVVVGPGGELYLTDGHHTFSSLYEVPDGGPQLKVWVKVDANYSDAASEAEFWQRMITQGKTWLRDGGNNPITPAELPTRVGMQHPDRPGGMAEDPYRSLVYFTRGIGYDNGGLPEFAEFYWADYLRGQTAAGHLQPMSAYAMQAPHPVADILAQSTLNSSLAPRGSDTSYPALIRDAALRMAALGDADAVSAGLTAAQLGRIALAPGAPNPSPTKSARDELEDIARNDVNSSGNPRGAGKLWFAVNYRHCGAPATGTCWGW